VRGAAPLYRMQECEMPIMEAVKIMWIEPSAAVDWTWNCSPSDELVDVNPAVPPTLYFWFIPLSTRDIRASLAVSHHRTYCCDNGDDWCWRFEWLITNRGVRVLPLKINIWTPLRGELSTAVQFPPCRAGRGTNDQANIHSGLFMR
jgi:hypothetical protein